MIYNYDQTCPEPSANAEVKHHDIEQMFINEVCKCVAEALDVPYGEQRIVMPLLKKALSEKLNSNDRDNPGLLQQYLAYAFDKAMQRLTSDLGITDVKVNHGYAMHAKFADITMAIKSKIDK